MGHIMSLALSAQYTTSYLSQFVIHSSLDVIDTKMWTHRSSMQTYAPYYYEPLMLFPSLHCSSNFLGEINFFNRPTSVVSAYVTPGMFESFFFFRHTSIIFHLSFSFTKTIRWGNVSPLAWRKTGRQREDIFYWSSRVIYETHNESICLSR